MEYLGCRFHDHHCQGGNEYEWRKERLPLLERLGTVIYTWECDWLRKGKKTYKTYLKKKVGMAELLEHVKKFHGFVKVDMVIPPDIIRKYEKLNFQMLFKFQ